ncbi:UNVERIFIED_CONTAM: hypothetical protein GTU68_064057, partial [Idotea baltica]|nr:hypothetical protein [Idotea baltica]
MKIKVGIFFGGPSREREISFAGGRTVYDNLNKSIFEPVPIFVDSYCNFTLLDWAYIYKGSIRDFFPPVDSLPDSPHSFQVYQESLGPLSDELQDDLLNKVGQKIEPEELPQLINVAFLALHGEYGEDGQIQQQLQALQIPYTGSGVEASKLGMDKARQKEVMGALGFPCPAVITIQKEQWVNRENNDFFDSAKKQIRFPMVIRPANQGSSIGVSIINEKEGEGVLLLEGAQSEEKVIVEEFIEGKEFSCIVIRMEDGSCVALPPTEIIKAQDLFDYRSKYMPGLSRKLTPIDLGDQEINVIRKECEQLFQKLGFQTYARIDGFFTKDKIFLNDPNTTSGMLPSSFFFHQAAEIGLNPSQFLTYIIRTSIQE